MESKTVGTWEHRGIRIAVTADGRFSAEDGLPNDQQISHITLAEVRDKIDAILESEAAAQKSTTAVPVIVRLTAHNSDMKRNYFGDAIYNGVHAGNGDALMTINGQKVRVSGYAARAVPVQFPEVDEYRLLGQEEAELDARLNRTRARLTEIEKIRGTQVSGGRISNDKVAALGATRVAVASLTGQLVPA